MIMDELAVKPCVGCGFCCKKARCAISFAAESAKDRPVLKIHGKIPRTESECPFLYKDTAKYRCFLAKQPIWAPLMDFGAGCCCSLNTERRKYGKSQEKTAKKS